MWVTVLGIMGGTAAVYLLFEQQASDDFPEGTPRIVWLFEAVWQSAVGFTGGGGFSPTTREGKVVLLAWSFTVLILVSAYTANLASNLVSQAKPGTDYTSYTDAVERGAIFCVGAGFDTGLEVVTLLEFWTAIGQDVDQLEWSHTSMRIIGNGIAGSEWTNFELGLCDVVWSTQFYSDQAMVSKSLNSQCNLQFLGQPYSERPAGWFTWVEPIRPPLPARERKCTALIDQVLSAVSLKLSIQGKLGVLYKDYLSKIATQTCDGVIVSDSSSVQFYPKDLAGVFVLHLLLCACAIVAGLYGRACRQLPPAPPGVSAASMSTTCSNEVELSEAAGEDSKEEENIAGLHEKLTSFTSQMDARMDVLQSMLQQNLLNTTADAGTASDAHKSTEIFCADGEGTSDSPSPSTTLPPDPIVLGAQAFCST